MTVDGVLSASAVEFPKYVGITVDAGGVVSDLGSGTASIPSNGVNCYDGNVYTGILRTYTVPAANLSMTAGINVANYIYVACGPTPTYQVTTDRSSIDNLQRVLVSKVVYSATGAPLHIETEATFGSGMPGRIYNRLLDTEQFGLSEDTIIQLANVGINITLTGLDVWAGITQYAIPATSGATREFRMFRNSDASWNYTTTAASTAIDITKFDNGTGLQTFTSGYWGIIDVYRGIEIQNHIYYVNEPAQYESMALADAVTTLELPPEMVKSHAIFVGRVVFQESNISTITTHSFVPGTSFTAANPVQTHNQLSGLEGGSSGNFYHLGQTDYYDVLNKVWNNINTTANIQGLGFATASQDWANDTGSFLAIGDQRYNDSAIILSRGYWTNGSNSSGYNKTLDSYSNYVDADAMHLQAFYNLGAAGTVGMPVYVSAYADGNVQVGRAAAGSASTMPAIGLLEEAGADGSVGSVRTSGRLLNVNTNAWLVGTVLYVSGTTGTLTATKPTTGVVQQIGTVLRQDATAGIIEVSGASVYTDIPVGYNTAAQDWSNDTGSFYGIGNPAGYINGSGVVSLVGNWSLDKLLYNTTAQLNTLYLGIGDQRYNETSMILSLNTSLLAVDSALNSSKAGIGNCPQGQVVMNTTTSGVQCVVVTATGTGDGTGGWTNTSTQTQFKDFIISNSSTGTTLQYLANNLSISDASHPLVTLTQDDNAIFINNVTAQNFIGRVTIGADSVNTTALSAINGPIVGSFIKVDNGGKFHFEPVVVAESINYTTSLYTSTSATVYQTLSLSLSLQNASTYLVKCEVIQYSANVNTGVRLRANTTGSPTTVRATYTKMSTATAMESFTGSSTSSNAFAATGSSTTANVGFVNAFIVTGASPSLWTIDYVSESTTAAYVDAGSYCMAYKVA
jgi:hypothetical protein